MNFDDVRQMIRERAEQELDTIGAEMVQDARENILSVPVEYTDNGFVIRSDPGEAPRYETNHLRNQMDHRLEGDLRLVVFNDAHYAGRLEFGDGKIKPRPFFGLLIEAPHTLKAKWIGNVAQRVVDAILGNR